MPPLRRAYFGREAIRAFFAEVWNSYGSFRLVPIGANTPELSKLYADFEARHLMPLWTQTGDLMPMVPKPKAVPHVWRWSELYPLAQRAGDLVPVGRGGERRAIGLANPGLGGQAYASPTLWAAIQYLGPKETAPEHRRSQNAFRFVVEGEGVWTVVNGDPVRMSRGDFLLTPGWHFLGHHNRLDRPMAWLDGLDIPFSHQNDVGIFELPTKLVVAVGKGTCPYCPLEARHRFVLKLSYRRAIPR